MRIYSENSVDKEGKKILVLYVDSEKTGDKEKDIAHCAVDTPLLESDNPSEILSQLIFSMSAIIHEMKFKERLNKKD